MQITLILLWSLVITHVETCYLNLIFFLFYPQVPTYSLAVRALDSGAPPMSSTVTVNIDISDINDNSPTFSPANVTAVIQVQNSLCSLALASQELHTILIKPEIKDERRNQTPPYVDLHLCC